MNSISAKDLLLQSANDAILGMDLMGSIIYCNKATCQTYAYTEEELLGTHFTQLLPQKFADEFKTVKEKILLNPQLSPFESQRLSKTQDIITVSVTYSVIKNEEDKIIGISSIERKVSEYQKVKSKAQAILETAPDAMVIVNASGQILLVNSQTEKLFGYSKEELLGNEVEILLPENYLEKHKKHRNQFFHDPRTRSMGEGRELYGRRKDGKNFPVEISLSPMKAEDGLLISAAIRDITLKKQAEEDFRWNKQQLDAFFTQALEGFFFMMLEEPIVWNDSIDKEAMLSYALANEKVTKANEAILKQYHAERENFIGLCPNDFFSNNIDAAKEIWQALFDKGRLHIALETQRLDGSVMWVEGDYICLYDHNNRITGHFGIQRDMTDKKRAEEELAKNEEKYRLLADNIMDMVALQEVNGEFIYVSPSVQKLLGFTPEELLHQNPYDYFHPEDIQNIYEASHKMVKAGKDIYNFTYRVRKKDGSYIWFSTNTHPIKNAEGEIVLLQTVSRDVTEQVHTLQQLEEINYQKNKLISVIGHDLRSPLTTSIGLLQLMQSTDISFSEENMKVYFYQLQCNNEKLLDLLDDLLIWVRAQSEKLNFVPQPICLCDIIDKVIYHLSDIAKNKGITLVNEVDEHLEVFAEKNYIQTVVRNLISNSIKFTPVGGKIIVNAKHEKDSVVISIFDNGIGMKSEKLKTLFTNSNFTSKGTLGEKGTGLGLELCKDFVNIMGGEIWAESTYGKGSKFSFSVKTPS